MSDASRLHEIADAVSQLAEEVADLTLEELRAQAQGDDTAKAREKLLAKIGRAHV